MVRFLMRLMGKRTCEEVAAVLHDFLDRTLDARMEAILVKHFEDCPDCRAFAAQYREIVRLGGEIVCDEIPEEVKTRVQLALRAEFESSH
jgi:hypothetical protein